MTIISNAHTCQLRHAVKYSHAPTSKCRSNVPVTNPFSRRVMDSSSVSPDGWADSGDISPGRVRPSPNCSVGSTRKETPVNKRCLWFLDVQAKCTRHINDQIKPINSPQITFAHMHINKNFYLCGAQAMQVPCCVTLGLLWWTWLPADVCVLKCPAHLSTAPDRPPSAEAHSDWPATQSKFVQIQKPRTHLYSKAEKIFMAYRRCRVNMRDGQGHLLIHASLNISQQYSDTWSPTQSSIWMQFKQWW